VAKVKNSLRSVLAQYTDWIFPFYELPFTGGIPGTFAAGRIGALQSIVPGDGPAGRPPNDPRLYGDNPNNPRDPDRVLNTDPSDSDRDMVNNDDHKEKRLRFIPSGWITKSCSMFSSG